MTDLRREFYEAMQKASVQWDFDEALEKVGKQSVNSDYTSTYNKIDRMILETSKSQSAINFENLEYDNQRSINRMYNLTKKSPRDAERERQELELQRLIELEREKERKKYRNYIKSTEKFQNYYMNQTQQSVSSSSPAAGAGRKIETNSNTRYVELDYVFDSFDVDDGYVD